MAEFNSAKTAYSRLKELGLTNMEIACYETIFEDGPATAKQLADRIHAPRTGLYRVLKKLTKKGFIRSLKTHRQPTYFYANRLDRALHSLASYWQKRLTPLLTHQLDRPRWSNFENKNN